MLLDNGAEGVPSDPPGAFEYFMKGAVADHHLSTHAAGCCFLVLFA
jgi:hypothetical protein